MVKGAIASFYRHILCRFSFSMKPEGCVFKEREGQERERAAGRVGLVATPSR